MAALAIFGLKLNPKKTANTEEFTTLRSIVRWTAAHRVSSTVKIGNVIYPAYMRPNVDIYAPSFIVSSLPEVFREETIAKDTSPKSIDDHYATVWTNRNFNHERYITVFILFGQGDSSCPNNPHLCFDRNRILSQLRLSRINQSLLRIKDWSNTFGKMGYNIPN